MKQITFIFLALIVFGCEPDSKTEKQDQTDTVDQITPQLTLEERAHQHVRQNLNMSANEKYTLKIYYEHLNNDSILDAVITVNRLDHAMNVSQKNKTLPKDAALDFWGNYNNFFYYDSELDKITPNVPIVSSATNPLKVSFENITSETHKDIIVDYRIRNSEFRRYYLLIDKLPSYVFQWKVFDGLGTTDQKEANCFGYDKGSYSTAKDIIIYKAELEDIAAGEDYTKIEPKITCSDEIDKRFFYNTRDRKYYTKDK